MDDGIATRALDRLSTHKNTCDPWTLTVSVVRPCFGGSYIPANCIGFGFFGIRFVHDASGGHCQGEENRQILEKMPKKTETSVRTFGFEVGFILYLAPQAI